MSFCLGLPDVFLTGLTFCIQRKGREKKSIGQFARPGFLISLNSHEIPPSITLPIVQMQLNAQSHMMTQISALVQR